MNQKWTELEAELITRGLVTEPQAKIISKILNERDSQDLQWGGPEHDDAHRPAEWLAFIRRQLVLAEIAGDPGGDVRKRSDRVNMGEYRERMVKTAALIMAALESDHRNQERKARERNGSR